MDKIIDMVEDTKKKNKLKKIVSKMKFNKIHMSEDSKNPTKGQYESHGFFYSSEIDCSEMKPEEMQIATVMQAYFNHKMSLTQWVSVSEITVEKYKQELKNLKSRIFEIVNTLLSVL